MLRRRVLSWNQERQLASAPVANQIVRCADPLKLLGELVRLEPPHPLNKPAAARRAKPGSTPRTW